MAETKMTTIDDICPHDHQGRSLKNLDVVTGHVFDVLQCKDCGLGWTDVAKGFDLTPYYATNYYGNHHKKFIGLVEWAVKNFRTLRAGFIQNQISDRSARILDVGCGRGWMLKTLKDHGWECFGTEFSEESSKHAQKLLGNTVYTVSDIADCRFPDNHFDVVTLWHVLEHLPNYLDVLQEIKRILKPRGVLIIEVPNFTGVQSSINAGRWIYLETPRHLYHFSTKYLSKLLGGLKFTVKGINTFSLELGLFGMVQSLLNLVTPIPNFLFALIKNDSFKADQFSQGAILISVILTFLFFIPAVILGFFIEIIVSFLGQGGVVRLVASNLK